MSYRRDYAYVDAHYEDPHTGARLPWVRLRSTEVGERIVAPAEGRNCFASIQRYKDSTSLRDLARQQAEDDASRKTNGHDRREEVRRQREREGDALPDQQLHWCGPYFDFDCDAEKEGLQLEEALDRSRDDAATLVQWLMGLFDFNPAHVQVWFSGKKGFHVAVRPEPFGIEPHRHLTYILRNIALAAKEELKLPTLDTSVYTVSRMWRIPNTVHPSTGRFKVELSHHELMSAPVSEILKLGGAARNEVGTSEALPLSHLFEDDEYKDVFAERDAREFYRRYVHIYESYRDLKNVRPKKQICRPEDANEFPVCIDDLMNNGPKTGGPNRNRVILPIAGFFADAGVSKERAHAHIEKWTKRWYPEAGLVRERLQNGRTVVESAYRGQVHFSCRFIRSLKGTGADAQVACCGEDRCPWIQDPTDQDPESVPTLHLADATKGCYVGSRVRTPIHVAAVVGQPYGLGIKGKVLCTPDPTKPMCQACPNLPADGSLSWVLDASDPLVLSMVDVNENQMKGAVKRKCGIPTKCFRHRIEFEARGNVEEFQSIPMVDYTQVYADEDTLDDSVDRKSMRHVVRRVFHMGHGIVANKKYMMTATVLQHPKDQSMCFLSDEFEPAQNDIDQFEMTPELYEQLIAFQPRQGQSVEAKLKEIHHDLCVNVHRIADRFDMACAMDLCYHAVIGFRFQGQDVHKGWFELVVCGDSGTGKTTVIDGLISHFGLGEKIGGEDSKRTGLVYASVQVRGQWVLKWGKIPQNDRRLLVIDEFAAISPEEIGKMTQLRSEGKARGGGVNTDYETFARTRLILLTNPRHNSGRLQGYNYGVQAVQDLFGEAQDLRRVDLAIVASKKEVAKSALNKDWSEECVPHVYTSDLCRNLVLWAWSREPHHVEWRPGAEKLVGRYATELGEAYDCDIELAEASDLKIKLARISAAVAARLFSTDSNAKKVLITKEHVEFAAKFMDTAYRKRAMKYFEYARKYKADNDFTVGRRRRIRKTFERVDNCREIVSGLLDMNLITKPSFSDMANLDKSDLDRLWKFMVGDRLIRKVVRGYEKSPAFTEFLGEWDDEVNDAEAAEASEEVEPEEEAEEDLGDLGEDAPF